MHGVLLLCAGTSGLRGEYEACGEQVASIELDRDAHKIRSAGNGYTGVRLLTAYIFAALVI